MSVALERAGKVIAESRMALLDGVFEIVDVRTGRTMLFHRSGIRIIDHPATVVGTDLGWLLVCACGWTSAAPLLSSVSFDFAAHHNEARGIQR